MTRIALIGAAALVCVFALLLASCTGGTVAPAASPSPSPTGTEQPALTGTAIAQASTSPTAPAASDPLRVRTARHQYAREDGSLPERVEVWVEVENTGQREVAAASGYLVLTDTLLDQELARFEIAYTEGVPLRTGQWFVWAGHLPVNAYDPKLARLSEIGDADLEIAFRSSMVLYEGGERVRFETAGKEEP